MEIQRKEIEPEPDWQLKIIFQRHGISYKKGNTPDDDPNLLGWLTPDGIAQTRDKAAKTAEKLIKDSGGHQIQVLFLNSPARYLEIYGARAQQTAEVAATEVGKFSAESEIIRLAKTQGFTRPYPSINEFHLDTNEEEVLERRYGGNFWELFYNMSDQLQELDNKTILAESSIEVSNRASKTLRTIFRFWRKCRELNPDKKFVAWCTTHGDVIRSFLQHGMGIGEKIKGWRSGYSEVFEFNVTDKGILSCDFQGQNYSIQL